MTDKPQTMVERLCVDCRHFWPAPLPNGEVRDGHCHRSIRITNSLVTGRERIWTSHFDCEYERYNELRKATSGDDDIQLCGRSARFFEPKEPK